MCNVFTPVSASGQRFGLCAWFLIAASVATGCSPATTPSPGTGGTTSGGTATASGGAPSSGGSSGGQPDVSGGTASGASNSGGFASGGTTNGGAATGGASNSGGGSAGTVNGGTTSGGTATGGTATGGAASGGTATGGTAPGGTGGGPGNPAFILGADISQTQEWAPTYVDTDGKTKTLLALLKHHGFNYVRLKTFVDPRAAYGYASTANGCTGLTESFGDRNHVVAFGKEVKAAGMGFLLDFHYSDTWADPGNQIIPAAWRSAANATALAALLKAYTKDVISYAVSQGARPDMVQIGNEITGGLLAHVPGSNTDCWGNDPDNASASLSGAISNWANTAAYLAAGIQGVREVDPTIEIMLHVENTKDPAAIKSWVNNAQSRGVSFDVLGLSCYTQYQGAPSVWESTFGQLASEYPNLKFAIAEYNPERTRANQIMKALPNGRGLGTFFWEPTKSGDWGDALFTFSGNTATAKSADFNEYDKLLPQLGLQAM